MGFSRVFVHSPSPTKATTALKIARAELQTSVEWEDELAKGGEENQFPPEDFTMKTCSSDVFH